MYEIFASNYTEFSDFLSLGFKYYLMFCCLEILELKCIYALKLQVYVLFCINKKFRFFIVLIQLRLREYKEKR
jgi:hypothetical protein